jgi:hypothetical protein
MWTYRSYVVGSTDVVAEWLTAHSTGQFIKLRAKLDVRMAYLRDQPFWKDPFYHPLTNQEGLGAVRFEYKNVQYRPLGFFGAGIRTFTFVYFATEKGDKYLPTNCMSEAIRRMKVARADGNATVQINRWTNAR